MNQSDFKIGESFWCNNIEYRCTDKGSRVIIAIQLREIKKIDFYGSSASSAPTISRLSREEAETEGWFDGPPYSTPEIVFDESDLPACSTIKN